MIKLLKAFQSISISIYFKGILFKRLLQKLDKALKSFKRIKILRVVVRMDIIVIVRVLKIRKSFLCMRSIVLFVGVQKLRSFYIWKVVNKYFFE